MDAIRLRNYRCFADTGKIDLKPVNILLGRNSVGKSSFLKFYPLLKQSRVKHPNGLFLWFSDDVDFKDFKNTVKDGIGDIEFELFLKRRLILTPTDKKHKMPDYIGLQVRFKISQHPVNPNLDYLSNLNIKFKDVEVDINFKPQDEKVFYTEISSLKINNQEINKEIVTLNGISDEGFLPKIFFKEIDFDGEESFSSYLSNARQINTAIRSLHEEKLRYANSSRANSLFCSVKDIESLIAKIPEEELENKLPVGEDPIQLFILSNINSIIGEINDYIDALARKIYYMQPLRANAKRYYRFQNLAVDEIDSHGDNLPMYLNSLSTAARKSLNRWIKSLFGFTIDVISESGHIVINIIEEENGPSRNLVDMGFGYSQLLPIIVQIWGAIRLGNSRRLPVRNMMKTPRIIVIEQPELHLHPKFMSDFAKMLVWITEQENLRNQDVRFIVETHSEALVEALGILIAKKSNSENPIDPSDFQILMFSENKEDKSTEILASAYDSSGLIENWPFGFFAGEE